MAIFLQKLSNKERYMQQSFIKLACIATFVLFGQFASSQSIPSSMVSSSPLPELSAKSWVLLEQKTGLVIAEKNADMRIEPASLTKLMTVYVLFQLLDEGKISLQDMVRVSENARYVEGSRMFAELGSELPVIRLLKGVIVQSGNDASIALAEHIDGSEAVFAKRMNDAANKLGLKNSQFVNVTGLPAEGHFSSARDIALLSRSIIKQFPQFYRWFSLKEMTHNNIRQPNRNRLLSRASWIDGLKTGHTEAAGYCLAATGKKNDDRFIAVVTGTNSDFQRTNQVFKLLKFAFSNYEVFVPNVDLESKSLKVFGGKANSVNLELATPIDIVVPRGSQGEVTLKFQLDDYIVAPVVKGEDVGVLRLFYKEQLIAVMSVQSSHAVELGSLVKRLIDRAKRFLND